MPTNFFQNLFSTQPDQDYRNLLRGIAPCITQEMNEALVAIYTKDEVYKALKSMAPLKALSIDSFPGLFYQQFWHVIGEDVSRFCLSILNDERDYRDINKTYIVLIP